MKIKTSECFYLMLNFVEDIYKIDPHSISWEVGDLLSGMDMFSALKKNISSPTMDPAYWYDWKELVDEAVEKDESIIDEINGLTLEQGLVAIQYFLEQRYWIKNNNMLLKDAYEDLIHAYKASEDNIESSQLWQEWLAAVAVGRKCDKIFQERG